MIALQTRYIMLFFAKGKRKKRGGGTGGAGEGAGRKEKGKEFIISEGIQWEKYSTIINTALLFHMDCIGPVVEFP